MIDSRVSCLYLRAGKIPDRAQVLENKVIVFCSSVRFARLVNRIDLRIF